MKTNGDHKVIVEREKMSEESTTDKLLELETHVSMVEDSLLKTMADNVVIIDGWIVLDNQYRAGMITAEEMAEQFSNFILPAAYQMMMLMETQEKIMTPWIESSIEEMDILRTAINSPDFDLPKA